MTRRLDRSDPDAPVPDEARLAAERRSVLDLVEALTREAEQIVESGDATNTDDEHDPDGATLGFERALATGLLARARSSLIEIDGAIEALAHGTYGTCVGCGATIAPARLDALPATRRCLSCAADPEAELRAG